MAELSKTQIALLRDLEVVAGMTTKMLSHHMTGTPRQRAGLTVYEMNYLSNQGLLARLDDGKPVVWIITAKGRAELSKEDDRG